MLVHRRWLRQLSAWVLGCQILTVAAPAVVPGVSHAVTESPVVRARAAYRDGEFGVTVRLLNEALAVGGLSAAEQRDAFEYVARACVQLGDTDKARASFSRLLDVAPDWRPDPDVVRPNEAAIFEEVLAARPKLAPVVPPASPPGAPATSPQGTALPTAAGDAGKPERGKSHKWWIVGGVAVVGGLLLALLGGDPDETVVTPTTSGSLPNAPSPPAGH